MHFLSKTHSAIKELYTEHSFPATANYGWLPSVSLEGGSHFSITGTPLAVGLLSKEVTKSCEDRIGRKPSMRDRAYFVMIR